MTEEPETPANEFRRLVAEYRSASELGSVKEEAWNLIADFAIDNSEAIASSLAAWNRRATPAVRDGLVERLANLIDMVKVEAASWRRSDCMEARDPVEEAGFYDAIAKALSEAAAALSLRPAETRVKPVEWKAKGARDQIAETPICAYIVEPVDNDLGPHWEGHIEYRSSIWLSRNTEAELKTAFEAEHEKRIKASISEPARAEEGKEPVAKEMLAALKACAWLLEAAHAEQVDDFRTGYDDIEISADGSFKLSHLRTLVARAERAFPTHPSRPSNEAGE